MSDTLARLRSHVRADPALKRLALAFMRSLAALSWQIRPAGLFRYVTFLRDWRHYRNRGGKAAVLDFYPCLYDRTSATGIDTHYFHQAVWAMREIRQCGPAQHLDIGSDVNFVGMLSAMTEVFFVDIRPLYLRIPNYHGIGASITALPFATDSVASLSCMHVIEHIGLGRYGDPIDPAGAEKACREIARVLRPGGRAYITTLIGRPRVAFNGHRIFRPVELLAMFPGLNMMDMTMVDVRGRFITGVDPVTADIRESEGGLDFGLGLFRLEKPLAGLLSGSPTSELTDQMK